MSESLKFYLLLDSTDLDQNLPFINILRVKKKNKNTDFDIFSLEQKFINYFAAHIRPLVAVFSDENFNDQLSSLIQKHYRSKSGLSQEVYMNKAISSLLSEYSVDLFKVLKDEKIYHRFYSSNSNVTISLCRVSDELPELNFEVVQKENGGLYIQPNYQINGQYVEWSMVKRNKFLLYYDNTYYPLKLKDYFTLESLLERKPEQYAFKPDDLMKKIILNLEEKYLVNRNNLFKINEITCVPQSEVLLSEISNSFLMITPRWNYDEFIIEGKFQETHYTNIDGRLFQIKRNQEEEKVFIEYLKALHPLFAKQINGYFYLSFDEAKKKQWFLKTYHKWIGDNVEIKGMDMLHHFRYSPFAISTEVEIIEQKGAILQLSMHVSFGKELVELKELKKLLLSGQSFVLLKDDSMGILTDEWVQNYGLLIKHGQITNHIITIPQWILLATQQTRDIEQLLPVISKEWWTKWIQWQNESSKIIETPKGLKAELRLYQHKGYEWISLLSQIGAGALLADDMGLGKTLQTIAFLQELYLKDNSVQFLIVCPASLVYNWYQEIKKFTDDLNVIVYQAKNNDLQKFYDSHSQVLICSNGIMRSKIDVLSVKYWDAIVLDESHHIKNDNAQMSKAIHLLSGKHKIALSGTPVMNNTEDLYSQMHFILPGYLGSSEFFRKEYAIPIDRSRDERKMKSFHKLISPFILRRTKQEVAKDLPDKIESVLWCEMDADQRQCYNEIKSSIRNSIFLGIQKEGINKNMLSILQGIQKLRQVCTSPSLVRDLETPCKSSIKLEMLMEELSQLGQHKALVFSQFKGMLSLIAQRCNQEGIEYYHIDGDTPIAQRMEYVNAFQEEDNSCSVFLISLKTGNAGLNLTAADYVFLVDLWWNDAVQQQAIDRTHRIGQDKNVFAYKMICKDTIEEKILLLQKRKKELSDDLVHEEQGFVKHLTEDDVAFLFD
ncbi:MAG: DEAD/DEAH box helicase [Chitinophagales bacterium]|nr:DEAD/DEAH box helicase [Chitinophagales bacterium]MCZ2394687.1 DEAD/DEAH box helicase [Chitinophagales bacterium]